MCCAPYRELQDFFDQGIHHLGFRNAAKRLPFLVDHTSSTAAGQSDIGMEHTLRKWKVCAALDLQSPWTFICLPV